MKYVFGSYGTNNVGDEAIFLGADRLYPGAAPIYVNRMDHPKAISYADLLQGKKSFDLSVGDELIIGGGGLIHCRRAVSDYLSMAKIAKSQGLKVSIQRVGFEALEDEWKDVTTELLTEVDRITVRSTVSQGIVLSLGFDSEVEDDFAYELYRNRPITVSAQVQDWVVVSLGSIQDSEIDYYAGIVRRILLRHPVYFVPHSCAYVCPKNNDLVTAHKIWSRVGYWRHERLKQFIIPERVVAPHEAMALYRVAKGAWTSRYHGYVFSDIMQTPLFAQITGRKAESFFNDRKNDLMTVLPNGSSQEETLVATERWAASL